MFTINDLEATAAFAKIIGEVAEPGDNLVLTGWQNNIDERHRLGVRDRATDQKSDLYDHS